MPPGPGVGRRDRVAAVRTWPIWGLAPGLKTYIIVVLLSDLLAICFAAHMGLGYGSDLAGGWGHAFDGCVGGFPHWKGCAVWDGIGG